MSNISTRLGLTAAFATLAVGALAGAASAQSLSIVDGPDASGSLGDILDVRIEHRAKRVVVTTEVADLRRTSDGGPSGLSIWLDTDRSTPGPEFVFQTGLQAGQDYALLRTDGWKPVGEQLTCRHHADFDRAADTVRLSVRRGCLGAPTEVRIAERMRDDWDASHPIIDWLKGTQHLTAWVAHA